MAEASLHAGHTAGEDGTQPVGVKGRAKSALNFILDDLSYFVAAQIGHGCGEAGWGSAGLMGNRRGQTTGYND